MRLRAAFISALLIWTAFGSVPAVQAKPAKEGAFLTEFAGNVDQVIQQVEGNRLVALRYAKHFQMDPVSVLIFFRSELSLSTLDSSASMVVYSIGESSHIVSETQDFKRGTKVFVNAAGVPIIEYGSGNPVATVSPGSAPGESIVAQEEGAPTPEKKGANPIEVAKQAQPQQAITPASRDMKPVITPVDTSVPPVSPIASVPQTPVSPVAGTVPVGTPPLTGGIEGALARHSPRWMLPLGIAGAVAVLAGGGGAGPSYDIPYIPEVPKTDTSSPPLPAVPEPVSFMTLGSGLAALAGGLVRRRRRAR